MIELIINGVNNLVSKGISEWGYLMSIPTQDIIKAFILLCSGIAAIKLFRMVCEEINKAIGILLMALIAAWKILSYIFNEWSQLINHLIDEYKKKEAKKKIVGFIGGRKAN